MTMMMMMIDDDDDDDAAPNELDSSGIGQLRRQKQSSGGVLERVSSAIYRKYEK